MPQPGIFACLAIAVVVLLSVIGCSVARFDLAAAYEPAGTVLTISSDDVEHADLVAKSPPSVHKTYDIFAQHHRTLPHRTRSLTPSRWWHHTPSWPTVTRPSGIAHRDVVGVLPSGRKLLTQFGVSLR